MVTIHVYSRIQNLTSVRLSRLAAFQFEDLDIDKVVVLDAR